MISRARIFYFVLILLAICLFSQANATYPGSEEAVVKAVERVEPSVVNIKTIYTSMKTGSLNEGLGSGVIISKDSWIITNAHVTRNAQKIFVTLNDGRSFPVTEWRANSSEDIAVLRIETSKLNVAPIGDSDKLKKGQVAIAIGNPWRFTSTVTVGCVSATGRRLEAGGIILHDMIQTDAAINPGNSGGALVNSNGEVIGINTIVYIGSGSDYAQGLSFAIPINRAMTVARALIAKKSGGTLKPWLGINVQDVAPNLGLSVKSGVLITGFQPFSPARNSGMKVGDVIISLNSSPINDVIDLQKVLFSYKPGDTVTIVLIRRGKKYIGKVTLEGMRQ